MKKLLLILACALFISIPAYAADELVRVDYRFDTEDDIKVFSGYKGDTDTVFEYEADGVKDNGMLFDTNAPTAYINSGKGLGEAYTGNFEMNFDVYISDIVSYRVYTRHFTTKSSATANTGMLYKEDIVSFNADGTLSVNEGSSLPSPPVNIGGYVPGSLYKFKAVYHGSDGVDGSYSVYLVDGLLDDGEGAVKKENLLIGTFDLEENFGGVGAVYFNLSTKSDDAYAVLDNFSVVQKPAVTKADDSVTVGSQSLKIYSSNFIYIDDLSKIKVLKNGETLAENTDYTVSYELKTSSSAEKLKWCVNPIINLSAPIEDGEYYVVDFSELTDILGLGFKEPYFTMPVPDDDMIFGEMKTAFDSYIATLDEFSGDTNLKTSFASDLFAQFPADVQYVMENTSGLSDEEFAKIISLDSNGKVIVNRPAAANEEEYIQLGSLSGKIKGTIKYKDIGEYTAETDFVVKKANFFENYTGENGSLYSYKDIFDDDVETSMQFAENAEITVTLDSAKAFGGFYVEGDNISSYEIYYLDLDADKLVLFENTPVKTDKLVFKINGTDIILKYISAFCCDELDEQLSDKNILKSYPFDFDNSTIDGSSIVLPSTICKYINLTWESSDENVINLFGNVFNQSNDADVILTVYMLDENGAAIPETKRQCLVTVPAKKTTDKKGTVSGGGSSGSSGLSYSGGTSAVAIPDLPPIEPELPFKDVYESYWGYDTIKYLYDNNIVNGKSETEFCPEDKVTREEFVKMLITAGQISGPNFDIAFDDVTENDWYYDYIKTAYNTQIVQGISESRFGVGSSITREDICVMLGRALSYIGYNNSETKNDPGEFKDADKISDYAAEHINLLASLDIISGYEDGTVKPQAYATRAECSKIIYSFMCLTGLAD